MPAPAHAPSTPSASDAAAERHDYMTQAEVEKLMGEHGD